MGACFLLPMHPAGAQNDSLISKTDIRLLADRRTIQACPEGGMV